jgi:putative flippase GtrA
MRALPIQLRPKSSVRLAFAALEERAPRGFIRFLTVGLGGLSVDLLVLWVLEREGLSHVLARIGSLAMATLVTWILNRRFTFAPSGSWRSVEFSRYALVALMAQFINYVVFLAVCASFPELLHSLAAVIGAVAAAGFSYTGQRFFTFAKRKAKG